MDIPMQKRWKWGLCPVWMSASKFVTYNYIQYTNFSQEADQGISAPLGYIMYAKGEGKVMTNTEKCEQGQRGVQIGNFCTHPL